MVDDGDEHGAAPENVVPITKAREPFWMRKLHRPKDGDPWPTIANALIILANDPKFKGMLGYNAFTERHMLMRPPPPAEDGGFEMPGPYPRSWQDEDVSLVQAYMQRAWSYKFHRSTMADAIQTCARSYPFHPVTEWLDTLTWDGAHRLDKWLVNVFDLKNEFPFGTKEWEQRNAYYRSVGSKFLIAAVRRVRQPGCKFDSLLILEGPQRIGKSTAALTLFGRDWFSDAMPPDLANRDAAIALHGLWCLEFAEIEHLVRTEIETIKAFLSRSVDHYRPVHGRDFVDVPRQGVLIGTTNSSDYLRDTTGNSRMWPVPCQSADVRWLTLNRDQLWAEASVREATGEAIWLDETEVQDEATETTMARMSNEVWEPAIVNWLENPETNLAAAVTSARVLEMAVGMSKDKMTKAAEMRVAAVLRGLGWERVVERALSKKEGGPKGKPIRVWRKPDEAQDEVQDDT